MGYETEHHTAEKYRNHRSRTPESAGLLCKILLDTRNITSSRLTPKASLGTNPLDHPFASYIGFLPLILDTGSINYEYTAAIIGTTLGTFIGEDHEFL
jgi:hypothetical protein